MDGAPQPLSGRVSYPQRGRKAQRIAMAAQHVVGASPVTFVSEDPTTAGKQFSIPLASLKFDDKGAIDPSDWPPIKSNKLGQVDSDMLKTLFKNMVALGLLSTP
jgi:hypothetical protein